MTHKLITILIVGQVLIEVAFVVNFWVRSVWQAKVTDLLLGQGLM